MNNILGYFTTGTTKKLILTVPKSLYPDILGIPAKDDFDAISDTPEYFIQVYCNLQ